MTIKRERGTHKLARPTFLEVKKIVDTLPIGFYANRRITCALAENAECSCYNPFQDCIEISYDQICQGLEMVQPNEQEELIRSNYYHEVSHAILTPTELEVTDIINIFEDERIETILNNFYYGIDFKKAVYAINHFDPAHPTPPANADQAFYSLVRFHIGPNDFLKRVQAIIKQFKDLNRDTDYWTVRDYKYRVEQLYRDFTKAYPTIKGTFTVPTIIGNGTPTENQFVQDIKDKSQRVEHGELQSTVFEKVLNQVQYLDTDFHREVSQLFANFNRKNSKGCALCGYSGVINPRLADRKDYKMFERSSTARGNNQFGTFHLNLFIDTSGSFDRNVNATNGILKALRLIEKSNPNFTFDIVSMEAGEKILDRENRQIWADGGNYLTKDIFNIYRKLQLPQTYNYNIILFDGDAYSNREYTRDKTKQFSREGQGFVAFANNNCSIISDSENKRYIKEYCPNTRTIYTNNYVKELSKNIIKILQTALN